MNTNVRVIDRRRNTIADADRNQFATAADAKYRKQIDPGARPEWGRGYEVLCFMICRDLVAALTLWMPCYSPVTKWPIPATIYIPTVGVKGLIARDKLKKRYAAQTIRYKTIANWKRKGIFGMHASRVAVSDRRTDGHWCRPAHIHTRLMATEQCVPCSPSFACLSHRTISQDKYNINDALVECWISTVDSNRFDTKQDCDGQTDGQTDTIRHTIPRCIQSHGETIKAHFCYKIQTAKTFLHRCLGN